MSTCTGATCTRRAQPLLGTLVEIGVFATDADRHAGVDAAFAAIREVQACLSRFDAGSDVAIFNTLRCGERIAVRAITQQVLAAARELQTATAGAFDISLGSALDGWALRGAELCKLSDAAHLDLGGIGKGHEIGRASCRERVCT